MIAMIHKPNPCLEIICLSMRKRWLWRQEHANYRQAKRKTRGWTWSIFHAIITFRLCSMLNVDVTRSSLSDDLRAVLRKQDAVRRWIEHSVGEFMAGVEESAFCARLTWNPDKVQLLKVNNCNWQCKLILLDDALPKVFSCQKNLA